MLRLISVSLRKLQSRKDVKRTLAKVGEWKKEISGLEPYRQNGRKLLIIRLDDIGDYLLFRNSLSVYKHAPRWQGYEITLLGFSLWQEIFEFADSSTTDRQIWLDKKRYFSDEIYRRGVWENLRSLGFEVVICPSRVRPLLLDDMCMVAAGAPVNIAVKNGFNCGEWNALSDNKYQELYTENALVHEFIFNNAFASWCCGVSFGPLRPSFPAPNLPINTTRPYIICFIGASFKSRRWPVERWNSFIKEILKEGTYTVVIAGGKNDEENAIQIINETGAESITGKVSLVEMTGWAAKAAAIVTNNTMAAHLGAAVNRPVVIVASGDNYAEFCEYKKAGITGVATVYPPVFLQKLKKNNFVDFKHYVAVTNDIGTIVPERVAAALHEVVNIAK